MSRIKVESIRHPDATADSLSLDLNGNVNIDSNTLYVDATNNRIQTGGDVGISADSFSFTGTLINETPTTAPKKLVFSNQYSTGQNDAQLKLYLFNSGNTRHGLGSGPSYDLQYHSSGQAVDQAKHRFYTDNVLRMLIDDGSQSVTKPTQPAFLAYSATAVAVSGGWNNLSASLTTEAYDIVGSYGTVTPGRFVAPIAGRYLFYFGGWSVGNTIDARYAVSAVVNNGTQLFIGGGNYCAVDSPLSGYSIVHNLGAGDFVDLQYYSAISTTWGGYPHVVYWGGYLLG